MFYKPSKFWDKFTLTHLIVLLSVRIVPEHSDKPVTKDSIRTRVCCFSFTVMWKLGNCTNAASGSPNAQTYKTSSFYTFYFQQKDCYLIVHGHLLFRQIKHFVLQAAILVSSVLSLAWGWGSNLLWGQGRETWCSPSQHIWNQEVHLKEPPVPVQ